MRTNVKRNYPTTAHGAPAATISPEQALRRSVMSCFLWEDEFYEDGVSIVERIKQLVANLPPSTVASIAVEARISANLRHVPLLLTALLAKPNAKGMVRDLLPQVIQRADELSEFLAIYAKVWGFKPNKLKSHLSKQVQRGIAEAVCHFDEYQLSKYNRNNKGQEIKLRDVLCLTHPRPLDKKQAGLFKRVLENDLAVADTWENELMKGANKKDTFTRLLNKGKLGYLALLRNLRNMEQAKVDPQLVEKAILARQGARRVLPFRYVAAAKAAPQFERALDSALLSAIGESPVLPGQTLVVVDTSGSMFSKLSGKSDISRVDAAATLASMINGRVRTFAFAEHCKEVPHRLGMAGVDAFRSANVGSSTYLGRAVSTVQVHPHDRIIVITDEQSWDPVPNPVCRYAYMINVASNRNGVGYGPWVHIDGFSEQVLRFIREYEASGL